MTVLVSVFLEAKLEAGTCVQIAYLGNGGNTGKEVGDDTGTWSLLARGFIESLPQWMTTA